MKSRIGHSLSTKCLTILVRGLFHRAVLMSGTSFSTWSLVEDPVHYAVKVLATINNAIRRVISGQFSARVLFASEKLAQICTAHILTVQVVCRFGHFVECIFISITSDFFRTSKSTQKTRLTNKLTLNLLVTEHQRGRQATSKLRLNLLVSNKQCMDPKLTGLRLRR